MPRAPRVLVPPSDPPDDEIGDDLTDEEIEQAAVGDLFTIQGPEFLNVSWSIWRFRTRAEMAADSQGQAEEWVADRTGELHGTDLGEVIGGGTFRFRGFVPRTDGRGVRLAFNRIIAIAGPRKNFTIAAADATPPPAPTPNGTLSRGERLMLKMLRNQDLRLQQLERTPAPAAPGLKEMAETLILLNGLQGKPPASDTNIAKELFTTMMSATKQGIELGQARDPLPADEENVTVKVIEAVAPLASRFLDVLTAARARPAARPNPTAPPGAASPPTAATPSTAEVVEGPVITGAVARWMVAVENLVQSIEASDPLEDAASDLETVLAPGDLAGVLASPNDQVMAALLERYAAQYPILAEARAREYVGNVLDELRTTPDSQ